MDLITNKELIKYNIKIKIDWIVFKININNNNKNIVFYFYKNSCFKTVETQYLIIFIFYILILIFQIKQMLLQLYFCQLLCVFHFLRHVESNPNLKLPSSGIFRNLRNIHNEIISEIHKDQEIKSFNPIIKLNLNNRKFFQNISEYQLFCVNSLPRRYYKIWSSASVSSKIV